MELTDYFLAAVIVLSTLFPIVYIFYRQVENKLFFLSACIGVYCLIDVLLAVAAAPFALFLIKVIPQLAEQGQTVYLVPVMSFLGLVQEYWFFLSHPLLAILLPLAIHRRYSLFRAESS
ncbi:hypothetical protein ACVBEJ_04955 [Porticoccus sp. GXU_MW_L64]